MARARIRFLTADPVTTDQVRAAILESWRRSRISRVPADHIDLPYLGVQDLDTPLIHGASPTLNQLAEQLDRQPISLILTDPSGVVLTQFTGDPDLHRHLERVELLPGFSYGERFVGTNGSAPGCWTAAPPTCSATSTTPSILRTSPAPVRRSGIRSPAGSSAPWTSPAGAGTPAGS